MRTIPSNHHVFNKNTILMFTLTNRAGGVNDIMKSDIPMMSVMTNVHYIPCFETYTKLIDNLE